MVDFGLHISFRDKFSQQSYFLPLKWVDYVVLYNCYILRKHLYFSSKNMLNVTFPMFPMFPKFLVLASQTMCEIYFETSESLYLTNIIVFIVLIVKCQTQTDANSTWFRDDGLKFKVPKISKFINIP